MRIAYHREGYLRYKKSMDASHPHSEVVGITVNPDKSRPCKTHRRLQLILRIEQHLKFPTFQSIPNNSKRLLYFPLKSYRPPAFKDSAVADAF